MLADAVAFEAEAERIDGLAEQAQAPPVGAELMASTRAAR